MKTERVRMVVKRVPFVMVWTFFKAWLYSAEMEMVVMGADVDMKVTSPIQVKDLKNI
jgi:hypothetical protein